MLPPDVAHDPERLARFEREAKVLASLNHPNIAPIYGFEDATLADGRRPLPRDGARRGRGPRPSGSQRGPLPVDEALEIARQIADALEAAHEKGIVHRDLKPANVKLTPDGKVKVLDFGLAQGLGGDARERHRSEDAVATRRRSRTRARRPGVILGTAAYMSPEQARGRPVDQRADIWAFGVVLCTRC